MPNPVFFRIVPTASQIQKAQQLWKEAGEPSHFTKDIEEGVRLVIVDGESSFWDVSVPNMEV